MAELRAADSDTAIEATEGLAAKVAADGIADAVRDAGLGNPSRATVAQAAAMIELISKGTRSSDGAVRAVGLGVAVFFGVLLAATVIAGVWMVGHRVAEIERRVDDFEVVKKRQDALVTHLLASVELIAKDMDVELPRPPAVLRIAEAIAETKAAEAASQ